jgi:hypothetical protein
MWPRVGHQPLRLADRPDRPLPIDLQERVMRECPKGQEPQSQLDDFG